MRWGWFSSCTRRAATHAVKEGASCRRGPAVDCEPRICTADQQHGTVVVESSRPCQTEAAAAAAAAGPPSTQGLKQGEPESWGGLGTQSGEEALWDPRLRTEVNRRIRRKHVGKALAGTSNDAGTLTSPLITSPPGSSNSLNSQPPGPPSSASSLLCAAPSSVAAMQQVLNSVQHARQRQAALANPEAFCAAVPKAHHFLLPPHLPHSPSAVPASLQRLSAPDPYSPASPFAVAGSSPGSSMTSTQKYAAAGMGPGSDPGSQPGSRQAPGGGALPCAALPGQQHFHSTQHAILATVPGTYRADWHARGYLPSQGPHHHSRRGRVYRDLSHRSSCSLLDISENEMETEEGTEETAATPQQQLQQKQQQQQQVKPLVSAAALAAASAVASPAADRTSPAGQPGITSPVLSTPSNSGFLLIMETGGASGVATPGVADAGLVSVTMGPDSGSAGTMSAGSNIARTATKLAFHLLQPRNQQAEHGADATSCGSQDSGSGSSGQRLRSLLPSFLRADVKPARPRIERAASHSVATSGSSVSAKVQRAGLRGAVSSGLARAKSLGLSRLGRAPSQVPNDSPSTTVDADGDITSMPSCPY